MLCVIVRLPFFDRQVRQALKKYPLATSHVGEEINNLAACPRLGDLYPGFSPFEVRKIRIGLPQYKIGKRSGLRLIHLYIPEKSKIVPLVIYLKKNFGSEQEIRSLIKQTLRQLEKDLASDA